MVFLAHVTMLKDAVRQALLSITATSTHVTTLYIPHIGLGIFLTMIWLCSLIPGRSWILEMKSKMGLLMNAEIAKSLISVTVDVPSIVLFSIRITCAEHIDGFFLTLSPMPKLRES
jgi:hypothetical protein